MIKSIKIIFLIVIWLFFENNTFSQYYVKFKGDSISFQVDSVILALDNNKGSINWQVSEDMLTWKTLNETNDTLIIRIDTSAYYRSVLTTETCTYSNSDVTLVSFKSVNVTGNTFTIDTSGCVYTLPSGIKLIVPPGAVNENVTLSLELLDINKADIKIPLDFFTGKVFCAGIYLEPTIIHFQKPIRIVVPASNYSSNDLPYIYYYNSLSGLWNQYYGTLICSEEKHSIEFTTKDFYPARIELIQHVFGTTKNLEAKGGEPICEKGLVKIENSSSDQTSSFSSGDCMVVSNNIEVKFLECGSKPVVKDYVHEISEKCVPDIKVVINKNCFRKKGDLATMTFKISIGGLPLENNKILVELPSGIIREPAVGDPTIIELFTDSKGEAQLTMKSDVDNVQGKIKWKADVNYFLRVIEVSGDAGTESHKEYEKLIPYEGFKEIIACLPVTRIEIWLSNESAEFATKLQVDDTRDIFYKCYNERQALYDVDVDFFVSETFPVGSAVVTVDMKTGKVLAKKAGLAYIKAIFNGIESNVIVLSVAYEGTLNMVKVSDNNRRCCCEFGPVPLSECWTMSYWGKAKIEFWLGIDLTKETYAHWHCDQTITYDINSAYCKSHSWTETVNADETKAHVKTENGERLCLTSDVMGETPFELSFLDMLFITDLNFQMTNQAEIKVTTAFFKPEDCVGLIFGECVLK